MLYATTRSKVDTYTARRALKEERSPDGGLYVPTQLPRFSQDELEELLGLPGPEVVAKILNRFFNTRLAGMEVSFALGRRFYGFAHLGRRVIVGELWRNIDGSLEGLCRRLTTMICAERGMCSPGLWMRLACRVALAFALFGELYREERVLEPVEVAVRTGAFEGPYALWLARQMGLPVGTILCCSEEDGFIWDLMKRGQMRGRMPQVLELYFHTVLGWDGGRFEAMTRTHFFTEEEQCILSRGFAVAVVGAERARRAMPNVYHSFDYILCPEGALVYAGVEDYRSHSGKGKKLLLLTEQDPRAFGDVVPKALDMDAGTLRSWCLKG